MGWGVGWGGDRETVVHSDRKKMLALAFRHEPQQRSSALGRAKSLKITHVLM